MNFIKLIIVSIVAIFGYFSTLAQTTSEKVEGKVTFVNSIPLPLGRYVQLADSSTAFSIQQYLASEDPNLRITFFMDFKVVRPVPEIEFMLFHAESLASENKIYIKFKQDQNAVEILSNANIDSLVSEVNVLWSSLKKANLEVQHNRTDKQKIRFTDSGIYPQHSRCNHVIL